MFNPYEYMLEIRNNRVLFQYLETSAVYCSDDTGWTIQGESREGKTEIYELAGGVIRMTLPIQVPDFINDEMLQKILDGLNPSIEGLVTISDEDEDLFIEYHLHTVFGSNDLLDEALLKFVQERADIYKGFDSLEKDYEKMKTAMSTIMGGLDGKDEGLMSPPKPPQEENLDSLWNEMENIDKKKDDSEDGESE